MVTGAGEAAGKFSGLFFLFSLNSEGKGSLESFIFEYSEKEQPLGARARKSPLCL